MIEGNDGGATVSLDGGRVVVDADEPADRRALSVWPSTTRTPDRVDAAQNDNTHNRHPEPHARRPDHLGRQRIAGRRRGRPGRQ